MANLYSTAWLNISDVNNENIDGISAIVHSVAKLDCFLAEATVSFIANSAYITG